MVDSCSYILIIKPNKNVLNHRNGLITGLTSQIENLHVCVYPALPFLAFVPWLSCSGALVREDGSAELLTTDHGTLNQKEFERVQRSGGFLREQVTW